LNRSPLCLVCGFSKILWPGRKALACVHGHGLVRKAAPAPPVPPPVAPTSDIGPPPLVCGWCRRSSLVDLFRSVLIKAAGLPVDTQTIFHLAYEVDDALDHRYGADPDELLAALCAALAVPGVRDLEEVKALGWDLAQKGRLGIHPGR
jgi:hypothetical protein